MIDIGSDLEPWAASGWGGDTEISHIIADADCSETDKQQPPWLGEALNPPNRQNLKLEMPFKIDLPSG
jgi:hypothetical protein